MYTSNEILFPAYLIPQLHETRGDKWRTLINRLTELPETHQDVLAFMLMMIRLNGCMECENDSYRAMRGCEACTFQTLRRFKGSDDELLAHYTQAQHDIEDYTARTGRGQWQALLELMP